MFDLTNEQSFLDVRNWLTQLQDLAYCEQPDIILVGNKADQQNYRVISKTRAKQFADTFSLSYIETSAITSENVTQTIHLLLDRIFTRIEQTDGKFISHLFNIKYFFLSSKYKSNNKTISKSFFHKSFYNIPFHKNIFDKIYLGYKSHFNYNNYSSVHLLKGNENKN